MADPPREASQPVERPRQSEVRPEPATVGTGSSIAIGCVAALLLLLLLAVALRAFTPLW